MFTLNPAVDKYLQNGCGRCKLYHTPKCKVHRWTEALETLRNIVLETGLIEELKWKQPVYTFNGKNVVLVTAFKHHCVISFFKGSLLKNPHNILQKAGENSNIVRLIKFTSLNEILTIQDILSDYIKEAIEIEKTGRKVITENKTLVIPEEFQLKMEEFPALKAGFNKLTPGRQRAYTIYFNQAKQSKTRTARIEKYMDRIMQGIGLHDDYQC